jgi:hypothetical protein
MTWPGWSGGRGRSGSSYAWIVSDDADTNLASSREAHDRIVVAPGTREEFMGTWKMNGCFTDRRALDHCKRAETAGLLTTDSRSG